MLPAPSSLIATLPSPSLVELNWTSNSAGDEDGFDIERAESSGDTIVLGDNLDISTQDESPVGITYSNDGLKLFLIGNQTDSIYQYDLNIAYSVSSVASIQSISITSDDDSPLGIDFNPNGSKMFICGSENDSVYEYDLSTNYDISTALLNQSFSVSAQTSAPRGVRFSNYGNNMYLIDGTNIIEYSLSTRV